MAIPTIREQLTGKCKHYTHSREMTKYKDVLCKAGVSYYELMRIDELGTQGCMARIPCYGNKAGTIVRGIMVETCEKYEPLTEEEIQKQIDGIKETEDMLTKDISPCCKALIDKSQVIKEGRYKNHGPRYCSKCHRVVYMV